MTTLKLNANNHQDIFRAASLLQAGELVAMPTETVYGLAANAMDPAAVAKIFAAKGRPQDNPLIVHISNIKQACELAADFPASAQKLAEAFWPGPLTMVLPRAGCVPDTVTAGLNSVALRMPAHPAALALLEACGLPLAAPSANRSGSPSPTTAQHVTDDLSGQIAAILDGGACEVGVESTVLSLAGDKPVILRPGGVSPAQVEAVLGCEALLCQAISEDEAPASPGMKYRHYAPKAELTLVHGTLAAFIEHAKKAQPDGLLAFDHDMIPDGFTVLRYGSTAGQQARLLYAKLREIDTLGCKKVLVRGPDKKGLGLAVHNRLLRAAEFREVGPVVGLTGPTGSGKSAAARMLAKMGCEVIDGDAIAREIIWPGSEVLAQLAARFGSDILNEDGSLNRARLASRAFENNEARKDLNAITHPAITALALEQAGRAGGKIVIIDAAALLESELAKHCSHIIITTAPEQLRLERILARDGIPEQAAGQRISAQAHMNFVPCDMEHTIIENTEGEAELEQALKALLEEIRGAAADSGIGFGGHLCL